MRLPRIIQGGMGVAISDWKLAHAVSLKGQLGVVSGTGIALVMIARLSKGDPGGHVHRALARFPHQDAVRRLMERYPALEGPYPNYPRPPFWAPDAPRDLVELTVLASFVEITLAKEGHNSPVGINLLEKIQMPTLSTLYGALLADVDVVIMGAGIPYQIPQILDKLSKHERTSYHLDIHSSVPGEEATIALNPEELFPGISVQCGHLQRPSFLPIISSTVLAKTLLKRSKGSIEGFVVEAPCAGGHNAPPRGPLRIDSAGEPIYGPRDQVESSAIADLGLPFWLAGGQDTPERLEKARSEGARGIQVGTAFAFCAESGMDPTIRRRVLDTLSAEPVEVRTDPVASPTSYPFKVAQVEGSLSDQHVYHSRKRLCDIGMLRQGYRLQDGSLVWRCPAEPRSTLISKGGQGDEADGAVCLCNALAATAGIPQTRPCGYREPAIVTSGDNLSTIHHLIREGASEYSAAEVLEYLLRENTEILRKSKHYSQRGRVRQAASFAS